MLFAFRLSNGDGPDRPLLTADATGRCNALYDRDASELIGLRPAANAAFLAVGKTLFDPGFPRDADSEALSDEG